MFVLTSSSILQVGLMASSIPLHQQIHCIGKIFLFQNLPWIQFFHFIHEGIWGREHILLITVVLRVSISCWCYAHWGSLGGDVRASNYVAAVLQHSMCTLGQGSMAPDSSPPRVFAKNIFAETKMDFAVQSDFTAQTFAKVVPQFRGYFAGSLRVLCMGLCGHFAAC